MKVGNLRQLKYNIWMYFIIYTAVIIMVLWVLQIIFLDSFYQKLRYNKLVECGNEISEQMNVNVVTNENIDDWINSYINASESGIYSYLAYYENGNLIVESPYSNFFPGNDKPTTNGPSGVQNSTIFENAIKMLSMGVENDGGYICDYFTGNDNSTQFCVYASAISNNLGESYLIMIASNDSLNESITVIQYQLIIVTAIVLLISFILAWTISTKLSEPIQRMSNTAKRWAEGDSNVVFRGNSYDELNELAEALNYAKEGISKTGSLQRDLLANVSHDLKTPLTMIKAYAEMIRDISGENKQKRDMHTGVIIEEADRLAMLVNDILNLSKLQNNSDVIELTTVNLSELVERVIYRFENFMADKGFHIDSDIDADLFTKCDESKIEQVVYNLIGNSLNYTGEDKTIKVHLHKKDDKLLLEIIDSGKGISPEQINGIWEKYYRFSETHQRPIKGMGLGLSIVKTILQNHQLKFGVISKKGVGSNFFVEFVGMNDERK
ncbi:MAG: HAMP domain-containing histidine kinase [Clostridia bacterium]|nr:HAMP domain-containing histidine kinase [Clostridia bacterium]